MVNFIDFRACVSATMGMEGSVFSFPRFAHSRVVAVVDTWLGLKLSWTALAVVLALLALHLFWPSTAIREHQNCFASLLDLQQQALE